MNEQNITPQQPEGQGESPVDILQTAYDALLAAAKLTIIEASRADSETSLSREAVDALNEAIGENWTEEELDQLQALQADDVTPESEEP